MSTIETKSEPDHAAIKSAVEQLGKDWHQFKAENDRRLAEIEQKGKPSAESEQKLARISAELDRLGEVKARLEAVETAIRRPGQGGTATEVKSHDGSRLLTADEVKARDDFLSYCRRGGPIERKAMTVNSDPDGGFTAPNDMTQRVIMKVFETSPMRQIATVTTISGHALEGLTDISEPEVATGPEGGAVSQTDGLQFRKWKVTPHKMHAFPVVSEELLEDSALNIEQHLARALGAKFGRQEETWFFSGTGVDQARGILTYADGTTWGTIERVKSGANGAFPTGGGDNILNIWYALKEKYRMRATWLANRAVILAIRKIKNATNGEYMWAPGLQAGAPDRLLGAPIRQAEDMQALATGSLSLAVGDFAEAYQIVDKAGLSIKRDDLTVKGYVGFYARRRVGGDVVNFEAIKLMNFDA